MKKESCFFCNFRRELFSTFYAAKESWKRAPSTDGVFSKTQKHPNARVFLFYQTRKRKALFLG